jgi:signal transduction histidine kinase
MKSEFLAAMSHELRTPLNAIIGFSEMMATQALGPLGSEKYLGYVNDIHGSGSRLLAIINDILDMAKIESGQFTLRENDMSLNEAARGPHELSSKAPSAPTRISPSGWTCRRPPSACTRTPTSSAES